MKESRRIHKHVEIRKYTQKVNAGQYVWVTTVRVVAPKWTPVIIKFHEVPRTTRGHSTGEVIG